MRLIDADALIRDVERSLADNPHKEGSVKINHKTEHMHFLRLIASSQTIGEAENNPLTLDELRSMDGEPVWNETMMKWQLVDMLGDYGPRAVDARGHWRELDGDRYYRIKPEVNNED